MATGLNEVTLLGNVGRNPEIRSTNDGKEMAFFNFATSEVWKDRDTDEKKERTEWHRIVIFHPGIISIVKNHVKTGSRLLLKGQLRTRKWIDKSGTEKFTTEVVLQGQFATLILTSNKNPNQETGFSKHADAQNQNDDMNFAHLDAIDDEIPF